MTIYENNIKILKEYRTGLYNRLKEYNKPLKSGISNIESNEAKDGTKILSVEINGKKIRLNSSYKPIQESDRWVEQYNFKNANCVVSFFGLGNGIFVRSLTKKINEGDIIILYEPSIDIFLYVIEEFDITDILENENIYLIVKDLNDIEFHNVLNRTVDWSNISSQMLCLHPYYDQIFVYDYKIFLKELKDNNSLAFINRNTLALMGKAVVKNTIHNLKYLRYSNIISDLTEIIPCDIPAIIVAAGPSLEKNIADLKKAKNRSIIFATDRALDFLLDNDIEPDFIVTLDPIKPVKYFSSRDNIKIPLFSQIESNQDILDYHKGRKIWYDSHPFFNSLYDKFDKKCKISNTGGSVATAAFSVCIELKIKRIILVGQDLAYSGKYTHAGGVVGSGAIESSIIEYVEDVYGSMIPTRYDWKYFKLWFEDAISNFPKVDVIDATEGGAKIKGTKIMALKEAISEYCKKQFNCKELMNNISETLDSKDVIYVKKYIENAMDDLVEIRLNLKELIDISNKLLKACKKNKISMNENQTLISKLSDINNRIIEKPVYSLLDTYISESSVDNLSGIYTYNGKIEDDQEKTFIIALRVYEAMDLASKEIHDLLKNCKII